MKRVTVTEFARHPGRVLDALPTEGYIAITRRGKTVAVLEVVTQVSHPQPFTGTYYLIGGRAKPATLH